ncbi:uncharacterized protein LOC117636985 [Prunus dulcis]|uniref:uncharacterized protein LOC117636985 n=1 Tax=Prunus dulcis TaxID=3755 RepID=UPI001482D115|nr:uncharacterized protein LOC117636985 [Prunus dulcis]
MSSGDGSKAPSSQVPLYLWGGSIVHSKKFVANLHRVTTDAQFQKGRAAYASAIPDDVRVKLLKSRKDNEPLVDANDLDARIITFRPFYFSLGFKFPLSKLFKEVFCAMGCAPSQCTPNVYRAIMCFENLSRFFMLELTVREFFYFFEVRHFERYAQVRVYKAKLFNSFSQGDHAWHDDVLEVSGRWEGDVGDGPLVPITYCDVSDISKQLEFGPDMAKVRRALNIPPRFREWRWLLSGYREEDGGLPPVEDVERWKQNGPDLDDLLAGQEECSAESLSKRKAAAKSPRGEATSSHAKDRSPSRKKPRPSSAEKTQVGSTPSSSARVKHLVGADNTKVGGMRGIRGVLPESPADMPETHDMFREATRARLSSAERQRDADIPPRSSSRLHRSKDEGRNRKSAHDPESLTPLEMKLAEAKKMRESSARAKGSSSTSAVGPKVNKPSSVGDACVSDLLKTNFLSNPSSCAELVDHIRQAGDLGTFSCLSLEKQREASFHLIQKGLIFAAETIRNSSAVAPSSAQLSELEKKNAELACQLSVEQARYEKKLSDLRAMISGLKSSLTEKDSELNSSAVDLASRKEAFFRLERKNADISLCYDKLLARFHAYHKSAKESKSEATIDAYKLGYLHCSDEIDSLYAIDDVDIETLRPNSPPIEGGVEEQVAGEDDAEVMVQADGVADDVASQADAEEAAA